MTTHSGGSSSDQIEQDSGMSPWTPAVPAQFVDPAPVIPDQRATLPGAFSAVVDEHSERVAIDDADGTCTFAELDAQSRALAASLRSRALAGPVAVLAAHGRATVVALLGIARAGRAAIVLDAEGPDTA